jgi:phage terminase large subunit
MQNDPGYRDRLMALPEKERNALLYGEWDLFDGQYFSEWRREVHVCEPFPIPKDWRVYRAFDYGLDMFAIIWAAVSHQREVFVFREYCQKDMIIRDAAQKANELTDEDIYVTLAPPDMWGRTVDQGRSKADQFYEAGLTLTKSSNDREAGWMAIHDLLRFGKGDDEEISKTPRLHIFSTCRELIRCLPLLVHDDKKPTDAATEPHDITHICDALRYFAVYWSRPNEVKDETPRRRWTPDMYEDYWGATAEQQQMLIKRWGKPIDGGI